MTDVVAGRYALVDPIGAGGFGTVWRAFDRRIEAYCAAKLLRQRDAGELLRFVREQSVRLAHPNIVSPYSWAAEDDTVLIASELVAGGSLHTLVGDYGRLAEGTVVTVLRQLLSGLQAVHDAELIHRDVKPANLLLHATGAGSMRLALTDFGLTISRRDARLTQVGMVIGTPGYLPPEVLVGGVSPDPRHDLYAVGRLALTLLAGEETAGPDTVLIGSIQDPALRGTVDALLRRNPDERPADASAALALLVPAQEDRRPRARDGEPIDVVDQLPELPDGWGPAGPSSASRDPGPPAHASPATVVDVALTAPVPRLPAPPPPGPPSTSPTPSSSPQDPHRARRRGPIVAAAALVVAVVIAAVVLVPRLVSNSPPADRDTTTSATGSASTSATTTGSGPTGTSGTATSTGITSTVPSATATLGPPPATLRAGDACSWQQEGDRQTGVDGPLACVLDGGSYQWRSP